MLIKTIRRFFMNAYVGIPMLCLFALTSYNSFAGRSTVRDFTGEELFKGVFFLEGDYSELIPELASLKQSYVSQHMSPQQKQNLDAERSRIINYIKDKDADFFDSFKDDIKTGERLIIKKSFDNSISLLKEAVSNERQQPYNEDISDIGTCIASTFAFIMNTFTFLVLIFPDDTAGVDSKSSLFQEQIINSICDTAPIIG